MQLNPIVKLVHWNPNNQQLAVVALSSHMLTPGDKTMAPATCIAPRVLAVKVVFQWGPKTHHTASSMVAGNAE